MHWVHISDSKTFDWLQKTALGANRPVQELNVVTDMP